MVRGQSAIVVGPAGKVIYTDRDHRIKLQFHWQRGTASNHAHSRLPMQAVTISFGI
jgi:type VI secretion system secreted protein VgrG